MRTEMRVCVLVSIAQWRRICYGGRVAGALVQSVYQYPPRDVRNVSMRRRAGGAEAAHLRSRTDFYDTTVRAHSDAHVATAPHRDHACTPPEKM